MGRPTEFLAWAIEVFGPIASNRQERAARFLEEAIELAQVEGLPIKTALAIIARVYARSPGILSKEIGQSLVTLECLAENVGISAAAEGAREWSRVRNSDPDEHRKRHAAKVAMGIAGK